MLTTDARKIAQCEQGGKNTTKSLGPQNQLMLIKLQISSSWEPREGPRGLIKECKGIIILKMTITTVYLSDVTRFLPFYISVAFIFVSASEDLKTLCVIPDLECDGLCVNTTLQCNNEYDCIDGLDESFTICGKLYSIQCHCEITYVAGCAVFSLSPPPISLGKFKEGLSKQSQLRGYLLSGLAKYLLSVQSFIRVNWPKNGLTEGVEKARILKVKTRQLRRPLRNRLRHPFKLQ